MGPFKLLYCGLIMVKSLKAGLFCPAFLVMREHGARADAVVLSAKSVS